jgi:hypothetical protein
MKHNRTFIKIFVIIVSIMFSAFLFLLIDFIYSNYFSIDRHVEEYKVPVSNGFYELKKKHSGLARWGDNLYLVKTDNNGFRVDESSNNREKKAEYIFLGDSFTFGVHNPYIETFVGLFDKSSNSKVLNAGVPSYSPAGYLYEYNRALELGVLEQKHTVIVGVDISDVQDEASYWQDGDKHPINSRNKIRKEFFSKNPADKDAFKEFRRKNFKLTRRISRFIRDSLRLARGLNSTESARDAFETNRSAFTWKNWDELDKYSDSAFLSHDSYYPLGVQGGLDRISSKLSSIANLAANNNANLYLLIYPWPAQIKYNQKFKWSEYINSICQEIMCNGVINAQSRFVEYADNHSDSWYKDLFVYGDTHYNINGNQLVFDELYESLLK